MIYYFLLSLSAILFSLSFYSNQNVERRTKACVDTTVIFTMVTWAEIFVILFAVSGGKFDFSPFSAAIASLHGFFIIVCAFLTLKAMGVADLGKYSLYMMLGGMLVPFVFGTVFLNERITVGKVLCCILVIAGLFLDSMINRKDTGKKNRWEIFYLIAVFLVNGSFGVFSALHQRNTNFDHVGTLQYMMLEAVFIVSFGIIFMAVRLISSRVNRVEIKNPIHAVSAYPYMLLYGLFYGAGELFVLFSIEHIDASVQYPIISGGTIVCSTLISMISGENKNKKRLIPVLISIAGILCLMIPA